MMWCNAGRQELSHYLNQCWQRSTTVYVVTRTQCVNLHIGYCWLIHIDGFVQDCGNSIALAMELQQSCATHQYHFAGLVQERHNSITNILELHLSCTNPSILCNLWGVCCRARCWPPCSLRTAHVPAAPSLRPCSAWVVPWCTLTTRHLPPRREKHWKVGN